MTKVVHCKIDPFDVYIGRPSKWGNPFIAGKDGTREEVVEKYRLWIIKQPELMQSLHELDGKTLACWCSPKACHGDVLVKLVTEQKIKNIKQTLNGLILNLADEKDSQEIIFKELSNNFNNVQREHRLSPKDVIDFYIGGIGIEVKLKNTASAVQILRQAERYCRFDEVKVFVLITARSMGFPSELSGKPCYYISLSKGML